MGKTGGPGLLIPRLWFILTKDHDGTGGEIFIVLPPQAPERLSALGTDWG